MVGALGRARHEDPENRPQKPKAPTLFGYKRDRFGFEVEKTHIPKLIVPFVLRCQVVATGGRKRKMSGSC